MDARTWLMLSGCLWAGCQDSAVDVAASDDGSDLAETSDTDAVVETDAFFDTDAKQELFIVEPSDPEVRYVGRWDHTDPSQPRVCWQGASVSLRFFGTRLDVELDPGEDEEIMRVVVDEQHITSTRFEAAPGVQTYVLASDLELGEHSVTLVKETYASDCLVLHGLVATGYAVLNTPETPTRHMEFYGDSNLAGYSLMSEQDEGGLHLQGSHFTYAGVTARAFGADYHNISISGGTLQGMSSRYDRLDMEDGDSQWDFDTYTPDVIVMNLGANDIFWPLVNENDVRQRYVTMLDLLREAHPDVHIVVFNAWGWDRNEPANYTDEVVDAYGDPNISVATFPWVFEQWHGCEADQGGMARYLIAHLESVLGWSGSEPDLMNGFGLHGDVANGGFEAEAPFGGFGWRYRRDEGVERIPGSGAAFEGDYRLRLSEGAMVHQPNPAQPGQTVTVSMQLRGASASDQAMITLDFRDQKMWTEPLQSEEHTVALTTDWTEHSFTATAPVGGAQPVFHTRLTVASAVGSVVEVDAVEMTTTGP